MNILMLAMHLGQIIDLVKAVEAIVQEVRATKKAPGSSTVEAFLSAAQKLVDSGIIQLPSATKTEIDEVFQSLNKWLSTPTPSSK